MAKPSMGRVGPLFLSLCDSQFSFVVHLVLMCINGGEINLKNTTGGKYDSASLQQSCYQLD